MALVNRIYFYGATDAQLNQWLEQCNEDLAAGSQLATWSAGDTSASHIISREASNTKRREMLLNDLGYTEAERAAMSPHDCLPVRRTVPRYV